MAIGLATPYAKTFATVPDSSINSWDSWFIFNLQKINSCYYTNDSIAHIYTEKDSRGYYSSYRVNWLLHYSCNHFASGMLTIDNVTIRMTFGCKFLLELNRYLSNVHTWAISFLRHLANTSRMAPFWASTDSGFVPNPSPRPKLRCPEEVVYSPNDSCSHFTQRLFPPKLPPQHTCTIFIIHSSSLILIIHHIQVSKYILLFTWQIHSFISPGLLGRPAALGLLCPIQRLCGSYIK